MLEDLEKIAQIYVSDNDKSITYTDVYNWLEKNKGGSNYEIVKTRLFNIQLGDWNIEKESVKKNINEIIEIILK